MCRGIIFLVFRVSPQQRCVFGGSRLGYVCSNASMCVWTKAAKMLK
jgi:hypothetical protein